MKAVSEEILGILFPHPTFPQIDLPPAAYKAAQDSWRYMAGLKSGQCFIFEWLEILDETWVHLGGNVRCIPRPANDFSYSRGIDIRADQIAWMADCDS